MSNEAETQAVKEVKAYNKVWKFLKTHRQLIFLCAYFTFTFVTTVFAQGGAEAKWDEVMNQIQPWISRLGAIVLAVGGIMFALGFKNDDADGKTRGMQTMIAGGLTMALSTLFGGSGGGGTPPAPTP